MRLPNTQSEMFFHAVNVLVADVCHANISIQALRIIASVKYLQRNEEEIFVGEVHAMYYEITKDKSWTYEACRNLCNKLSKKEHGGWLDKHQVGRSVAYTLTNKAKDTLGW